MMAILLGDGPSETTPVTPAAGESAGSQVDESGSGSGVKSEILAHDDEEGIYNRPASSSGGGARCKNLKMKGKPCKGCGRRYLVDFSYYLAAVFVEWLYGDGRGDHCRDCHVLWKRMLSATVALALLPQYIVRNFELWHQMRLARITLVKQGCGSIEPQAIMERVELLKWLSALLGLPFFSPLIVRTITDSSPGNRCATTCLTGELRDGTKALFYLDSLSGASGSGEQRLIVKPNALTVQRYFNEMFTCQAEQLQILARASEHCGAVEK